MNNEYLIHNTYSPEKSLSIKTKTAAFGRLKSIYVTSTPDVDVDISSAYRYIKRLIKNGYFSATEFNMDMTAGGVAGYAHITDYLALDYMPASANDVF